MNNIFVVGKVAAGDSFFGREKEIQELSNLIFDGLGAVHLVGSTRCGKSSLVKAVYKKNSSKSKCLCVQISMAEITDAIDFWNTLANQIKKSLKKSNLWNDFFKVYYEEIDSLSDIKISNDKWYNQFRGFIKDILEEINDMDHKLILTIDEFDSVIRIFGNQPYHYQLLASIYADPDYSTSGVIISRRRLKLLEAECEHISTFHGKFSEMPLRAFSDQDMKNFYEVLALYDIEINDKAKKVFEDHTGRMPYMCCIFANKMVLNGEGKFYNEDDIKNIFRECINKIDQHYEDLIKKLETDNYIEFISYLSIDSKIPKITPRDIENMKCMGVLSAEEKNNSVYYYSFSKDFMNYLKLRPLKNLDNWNIMIESEKKLKKIFGKEFSELNKITYDELNGINGDKIKIKIQKLYPKLKINWDLINTFGRNLSMRKDNATILDVMTLSSVINSITLNWDQKFAHYFDNNSAWKRNLELIRDVRNPMAHGQLDTITEEELAECMKYCNEIIRMKY